jgi:hypothetical protein
MLKAIKLMVNVTEYHFEWRDLPLTPDTHTLIRTIGSTFTSCLSTLVFHARIRNYEHFLSSVNLEYLHTIDFHFDFDTSTDSEECSEDNISGNRRAFTERIAPFINRFSRSLRCLKITSSARVDHTSLFQHLKTLSCLQSFYLRLPFDDHHLSDPLALHGFLARIPSPTQMELRPVDVKRRAVSPATLQTWAALSKQSLLEPHWLQNLASLTVPTFNHPTTISLIQQAKSVLTSLSLLDRYLTFNEVREVLDILSPSAHLRKLMLEVEDLTPALINLFAHKAMGLSSLTLVIENPVSGTARLLSIYSYHTLQSTENHYLSPNAWKLYDIGIYLVNYGNDSIVKIWTEDRLMRLLSALALPHVQSFKGRGHMNSEYFDNERRRAQLSGP